MDNMLVIVLLVCLGIFILSRMFSRSAERGVTYVPVIIREVPAQRGGCGGWLLIPLIILALFALFTLFGGS
jgi:hypothetical protein